VKCFDWSKTFPKYNKKFFKPLNLHIKGIKWSMTFPKMIPKIPQDIKQDMNSNLTFLKKVNLIVK
jgi:hypothetical protein